MRKKLRFRSGSLAAAVATAASCAQLGIAWEPVRAAAAVVAPIVYGSGAKADARLGIAAATVAELTDAPPLIAERGSQAFIGDAFARFEAATSDAALRGRFVALRERLRARTGRFDPAVASDYQSAVVALLRALPAPRDRLFLLGNVAQQIAYNARVLRETAADTDMRDALGKLDAGDRTVEGLAGLRAQLAALGPDRWSESAQRSQQIVVALLGSADAAAFPSAPRIWTILVRSRRVAGRDAAHLAIAVVWFDGHHDTYAAYPDGDAFERDAPRMTCRRNREPPDGNVHSTPLVPPPRSSYDALAATFERACAAFTAKAPEYRAADKSDDRFIAAMLTYAGIDPQVLRGHGTLATPAFPRSR